MPELEEDDLMPYWINDELVTPCFKAALKTLTKGSQNTFFKQIYNIFDTATNFHLTMSEVDSIAGAYATEDTIHTSLGVIASITLNKKLLKKCSQEWISYIFIHEIAHAAMDLNLIQWDSTNTQHEAMISTYLNSMVDGLTTAYPSLSYADACAICYFAFNNAVDGIAPNQVLLSLMLKKINQKLISQNQNAVTVSDLIIKGQGYSDSGTLGTRLNCN